MSATLVLSVHAMDPLGDEGLLADAATLSEMGCRAACVATAVLAAGTTRLDALQELPLGLVGQQIETVMEAGRPAAVRTGLLTSVGQVELVAELLGSYRSANLVAAPVVRVRGTRVVDEGTLEGMRRHLFPRAAVVAVRAADLDLWTGCVAEDLDGLRRGAERMREQNARAVLVTGFGSRGRAIDLLDVGGRTSLFDTSRVIAARVAGLASAHATALAAHLARGMELPRAAAAAQRYVGMRLERG